MSLDLSRMKKIVLIILILTLLTVIYRILSSIISSYNNSNSSQTLKSALEEEESKNAFLKEKLKYVQTEDFVSTQARNQLGLVKKDEYVILAPPPEKKTLTVGTDQKSNWKKWVEVFY